MVFGKLSVESMKKRVIGSAVTLGIYMRGINEDSPLQDCFEALLRMNDNDIMEAQRYKQKKLRQFNEDELSGVFVSSEKHRFRLLDESDGTLYDYDSINNLDLQGGNSLDDRVNLLSVGESQKIPCYELAQIVFS